MVQENITHEGYHMSGLTTLVDMNILPKREKINTPENPNR